MSLARIGSSIRTMSTHVVRAAIQNRAGIESIARSSLVGFSTGILAYRTLGSRTLHLQGSNRQINSLTFGVEEFTEIQRYVENKDYSKAEELLFRNYYKLNQGQTQTILSCLVSAYLQLGQISSAFSIIDRIPSADKEDDYGADFVKDFVIEQLLRHCVGKNLGSFAIEASRRLNCTFDRGQILKDAVVLALANHNLALAMKLADEIPPADYLGNIHPRTPILTKPRTMMSDIAKDYIKAFISGRITSEQFKMLSQFSIR